MAFSVINHNFGFKKQMSTRLSNKLYSHTIFIIFLKLLFALLFFNVVFYVSNVDAMMLFTLLRLSFVLSKSEDAFRKHRVGFNASVYS